MPRSVFLSLSVVALLFGPVASASAAVRITKIYYDSPGSDGGSNKSLTAEYIVIKNTGSASKSLTGWKIRDVAGHVYKFGTFRLGAGKTVTVHTGSGSNTASHRYWQQGWYVWNNDKDTATIKNKAGTVIDRCSYNSSSLDYKLC